MSKRSQDTQDSNALKKRRTDHLGRPAIINEVPVDQDIVDGLQTASEGDFRAILGIKKGIPIEIEYEEGKWTPAVIEEPETGETHRFIDEDRETDDEDEFSEEEQEISDDEEAEEIVHETEEGEITVVDSDDESLCSSEPDFVDTPVVKIHLDGARGKLTDVCFINKCLIYDIEKRDIFNWKMFGEKWEDEADMLENSHVLNFVSMDDLKDQVRKLVPSLFIDVLQKNKVFFEQLPFTVKNEMTAEILMIKDAIVDRIIKYFEENSQVTPGTPIILDKESMKSICDEAVEDVYKLKSQ